LTDSASQGYNSNHDILRNTTANDLIESGNGDFLRKELKISQLKKRVSDLEGEKK